MLNWHLRIRLSGISAWDSGMTSASTGVAASKDSRGASVMDSGLASAWGSGRASAWDSSGITSASAGMGAGTSSLWDSRMASATAGVTSASFGDSFSFFADAATKGPGAASVMGLGPVSA